MSRPVSKYCDGITRRSMIQAGLAGTIGMSLPDLLRCQALSNDGSGSAPKTSVIFIELAGGPTQHETYDPKPQAPVEYRGPLKSIETVLPGVRFSQHMSAQARIADKLTIVRSVHHNSGAHVSSSHLTQTGYYIRDSQNRDNEMPCVGSYSARLRGANADGVPPFVALPNSMRYGRAAWLGNGYNPFETVKDANDKTFDVANLTLMKGITAERLEDRRSLLEAFESSKRLVDSRGVADSMDQFTQKAFEMVTGDAARRAFNITAENKKTRARYGATPAGQNLLLARRLVENGVTFVSVRVPGWDDHRQIAASMKRKGPAYDAGMAALVEDLYDRGLERDVLVVAMGEFGRTPRVNRDAGRDHWGQLMSVVVAGGGLRTGQIIGSSDSKGAVPVERPYRPENVLAIIYRHLGIDTSLTYSDNSGRPRYVLERRECIAELV